MLPSLALAFLAAGIFLLLAGVMYQARGTREDRLRIPALGRLVRVGNRRLHIYEQGQGRPTVVLESGLAGTSMSWAFVQERLSRSTRVISYDRSGLGWSEPGENAPSLESLTADLAALLHKVNAEPPYILVGHSFGGLLVRAFAHRLPNKVAGVILVDPVSLMHWAHCGSKERARLELGVRLSRRGALLARVGVVRLALNLLSSGRGRVPELISRASARHASGLVSRLAGEVKKLPPALWPAVCAHWCQPKCFRAMAASLELLPEAAANAEMMKIATSIPITIVSASQSTEDELKEREQWLSESLRGRHIVIQNCGHWVQLEHPEAIVQAVQDMSDLCAVQT